MTPLLDLTQMSEKGHAFSELAEDIAQQEIQTLVTDRTTAGINRLKILQARTLIEPQTSHSKLSIPTKMMDKKSKHQLKELAECESIVQKMDQALYEGGQKHLQQYRNFTLTTAAWDDLDLKTREFNQKQGVVTQRCQTGLKKI